MVTVMLIDMVTDLAIDNGWNYNCDCDYDYMVIYNYNYEYSNN